MHAHKAPPTSSLSALPPCLVPQASQGRAAVVAALADRGPGQRPVGGIPQSWRGGGCAGGRFLVARYRCQGAVRPAHGMAWA